MSFINPLTTLLPSDGDVTLTGGSVTLSGDLSLSNGSLSGGGGSNKLPPAPYVQLRYCEYQP